MRRLNATVSAVLITVLLPACGVPSTDVADVSVVTDLPKEVGPGGLQSTVEADGVASGIFYKAEISDCGAAVLDSASAWAGRRQLMESEREVGDRAAQVRLATDEASGRAFVVRYSLASGHSLARVRITYEWGADGTAPTPQELGSLAVPELVQAAIAAAQCEGSD
jgi:hypothetical protein